MTLPIFPYLQSMDWNTKKTQKWNTIVKKSGSNKRKAMTNWAYPEWMIDCSFVALDPYQVEQVAGFLGTVKGQLIPFLWLDMEDYKQSGTVFGQGDGTTQRFQLLRSWAGMFYEPVTDIVDGSLIVYQGENRTSVTLEDDGMVYFSTPPLIGVKLSADFHYYWRVALADDDLDWDIFWYNLYKLNKFKVVTVR